MRKKITALFAIALLSASATPAFAQYGPNGLCDADQMRLCGEQVRRGANYLYNQINRFLAGAKSYYQKHSDQLLDQFLRAEAFSPLPSASAHRGTYESRREKQKENFNRNRNKKTVVNTHSYETNPPARPTQKPASNRPATKKK